MEMQALSITWKLLDVGCIAALLVKDVDLPGDKSSLGREKTGCDLTSKPFHGDAVPRKDIDSQEKLALAQG